MELKELEAKMHEFVASKGWYKSESPKMQTPRNLAASLVIEAAEVLELFQWREEVDDKDALGNELADVALYLLQLASIVDIDLEEAILTKLEENHKREW
jgi:NTP pyrophosphatase (non-canonical NTP hydrolase)